MRPLLLAGLLIVLAGCAATSSSPQAESAQARSDSDQTSVERRARVRLELASAYLGRGQASTALDEVKAALAAKPDLPDAYNLRGLAYATLGEMKLAEESFQRALQLAPRDLDTLQNYGWFLCQQGRFADSELQFAKVLAQPQNPNVTRTLLAQGVCQARAGHWTEAEATLSRSYELDPANPTTAYNLSDVMYRRGELERARFYIKRVNAVREYSNAQTLWLAARIEHKAGDTAAMQDFARQLRDRFPQSPEALALDQGRFDD
jgi:type IV pilus assembly protein PilF